MSADPIEYSDYSLPRPDTSELNSRGVQSAKEKIEDYCNEIIDMVYAGVSIYLETDKESALKLEQEEFPPGEVVGLFVKQDDSITAPLRDSERVRTFFTRLEPEVADDVNTEQDTDDYLMEDDLPPETLRQRDKRFMKLYVPVGSIAISSFMMPEAKDVNEVYIHTVSDEQEQHWYAIARGGHIYEYSPDEGEDYLTMSDDSIWESVNNTGVPETLITITELFKHVVSWKTVPQVLRTIK